MEENVRATEPSDKERRLRQAERVYEALGYHISVHFRGNTTLLQCLKNLAECEEYQ